MPAMPPFNIEKCVQYIIDAVEKTHSCSVEESIRNTSNYGASEGLIEQVKSAILAVGGYEATQITNFNKVNYYISKKPVQENENPVPINISGNTGSVFYQSPVTESIIDAAVAPTVTPKKKISINKIIAVVAGIITIILGIIFFYDRCNK